MFIRTHMCAYIFSLVVHGRVSLKRVKLPTFVFSAREDHIVPWRGGYMSARTLGGKVRFILGASGHIAGTINPASKGVSSGPSSAPQARRPASMRSASMA
jgi:polyhydroxyalkanoate synthase